VMIVGVGVLNLLAALDIFYSAQDPALLVTGLLVIVNLLIGLAISYLAVVEVTE
jgi:flagellar biosynthesis protein FliQ